MRIAILSDIHANREAFDAVLDAVGRLGVDETVLLGDIVGYGPDPAYAVDKAGELVGRGALCLLGNHDEAACIPSGGRDMTENARFAIEWTRRQLSSAQLEFLRLLPLSQRIQDRLYVHASADQTARWNYVDGRAAAVRCLAASDARTMLCGHTHVPAIFYDRPGSAPLHFRPLADKPAPLPASMRQLVVVGSVGQPRDGNPSACFGLLDTGQRTITMVRVPYDHDETRRKILACGLPAWLGMRLLIGR